MKSKPKRRPQSATLMVRLDEEAKSCLSRAAKLRQISVSDYVRNVTVAQARRELKAAQSNSLSMTADEQLAFWTALQSALPLTPAPASPGCDDAWWGVVLCRFPRVFVSRI